jgi:hypothetical protein
MAGCAQPEKRWLIKLPSLFEKGFTMLLLPKARSTRVQTSKISPKISLIV